MTVLAWLTALAAGCGDAPPRGRTLPSGPADRLLAIEHRSDMSGAYVLARLRLTLDGEQVYLADTTAAGRVVATPVCATRRMVQAGTHEVVVEALYRGHGVGVFSYLSGYSFTARSRHLVDVPRDALGVVLTTVGYERGGSTAPLEERPQIRADVHVEASDPGVGCFPAPLP